MCCYEKHKDCVCSKSDGEIVAYFEGLRALVDELGLEICQTHGRIVGFRNIPEEAAFAIKVAKQMLKTRYGE